MEKDKGVAKGINPWRGKPAATTPSPGPVPLCGRTALSPKGARANELD